MKKILAFTLAETLIVMGIIGVVAALTIPNLNSSTADKEKVAKLQKIYSNLQDAIGRAEATYGPIPEWNLAYDNGSHDPEGSDQVDSTRKVGERLGDFLKASKTCGMTANTGCFSPSSYTESSYNNYKYLLADGTSLAIYSSLNSGWISFIVDIDGPKKGTFEKGKDRFEFYIPRNTNGSDNLLPDEADDISENSNQKPKNYPTRWVLRNGNMDYLKTNNEGKCPNGKILDWTTNTSCK